MRFGFMSASITQSLPSVSTVRPLMNAMPAGVHFPCTARPPARPISLSFLPSAPNTNTWLSGSRKPTYTFPFLSNASARAFCSPVRNGVAWAFSGFSASTVVPSETTSNCPSARAFTSSGAFTSSFFSSLPVWPSRITIRLALVKPRYNFPPRASMASAFSGLSFASPQSDLTNTSAELSEPTHIE